MDHFRWAHRLFGWLYGKFFSKRACESFLGCIPIAVFIICNSSFLLLYSVWAFVTLGVTFAVLPCLWSFYGLIPVTDKLRCGDQMNSSLAFWAFVFGLCQSFQWITRWLKLMYGFYKLSYDHKRAIFAHFMSIFLPEKWQFTLGLVWDDIGGWIFIVFWLLVGCIALAFVCEMYRSFYLHVLDGSRGWEIGAPSLRALLTETAEGDTTISNSNISQSQQQSLLSAADKVYNSAGEVVDSIANTAQKRQGELIEYQEKLMAYYEQYGDLGQRAAPTGLPVEQYLKTLPSDNREKWERYLAALLAEREREISGTSSNEEDEALSLATTQGRNSPLAADEQRQETLDDVGARTIPQRRVSDCGFLVKPTK